MSSNYSTVSLEESITKEFETTNYGDSIDSTDDDNEDEDSDIHLDRRIFVEERSVDDDDDDETETQSLSSLIGKPLEQFSIHLLCVISTSAFYQITILFIPILIGTAAAIASGHTPSWLISNTGEQTGQQVTIFLTLGCICLYSLIALLQWLYEWALVSTAVEVQHSLRMSVMDALLIHDLALTEYRDKKTVKKIAADCNLIYIFLRCITVDLVQIITLSIVAPIIMLKVSWQLTIIALSPSLFVAIGSILHAMKMNSQTKLRRSAMKVMNHRFENTHAFQQFIKSFTGEAFEYNRVARLSRRYRKFMSKQFLLQLAFAPVMRMFSMVGMAGLLLLGSYWIGLSHHLLGTCTANGENAPITGEDDIGVGEFVFFLLALEAVIRPFSSVGNTIICLIHSFKGLSRVARFLQQKSLVQESARPETLFQIRGKVELKNVSFTYPFSFPSYITETIEDIDATTLSKSSSALSLSSSNPISEPTVNTIKQNNNEDDDDDIDADYTIEAINQDEFLTVEEKMTAMQNITSATPLRILDSINLCVSPNQSVAVLGITNSGKSTIVKLISRFYDTTNGEVLLDSVNVQHLPLVDIKKNIGIVSHKDCYTIRDTITSNVNYGSIYPQSTALKEVQKVCKIAGAHNFIKQLPLGYDTILSETGEATVNIYRKNNKINPLKLTEGQLRRINIARALLKKPQILLLDDPTLNIDTVSSAIIQKQMEHIAAHKTTIVFTSSIALARQFNLIHVLHNGKIVESGSFEQLISQNGFFTQICDLQFGSKSFSESY